MTLAGILSALNYQSSTGNIQYHNKFAQQLTNLEEHHLVG